MWKRDFVGIYNSIEQDWSPTIKPIITALQGEIHVIIHLFSYKLKNEFSVLHYTQMLAGRVESSCPLSVDSTYLLCLYITLPLLQLVIGCAKQIRSTTFCNSEGKIE